MPAPNIATLFDLESPYEDSLRNYFANVNIGGVQFAQILTPRTNTNIEAFSETPRLQIKAAIVGLQASGSGVQEDTAVIGATPTTYYSYYTMSVTLDVVTQRSNASQPHGLYRGATRQGMLEYTAAMNANTVPYYQTVFVNPGSSNQMVDLENDAIITQISYTLDFHIPPTSFPNS